MRHYRGMIRLGVTLLSAVLIWQGVLLSVNAQMPIKQPGDHDIMIMVNKVKRHFIVHVPTNYEDGKAVPLVIMLHGHGGTAKGISNVGWSQVADQEKFLVAYPDALRINPDLPPGKDNAQTWNDTTGRDGSNTNADDVGFVKALLTVLSNRLSVDKQRIYLAGFSQGGLSTFNFGIMLSDQIAAIGVASAPFVTNPDSTPKLTHLMPLVYIIGTADPLNPLNGGEAPNALTGGTRTAKPVQETIDGWLKLNDCDAKATIILDKDGVHGESYNCKPNFEVDYYTIEGMEHTWSIGPRPGKTDAANKLNGAQTMWEFFSKFSLSEEKSEN